MISIITPHLNDSQALINLSQNIQKLDVSKAHFELIIADGGSAIQHKDLAQKVSSALNAAFITCKSLKWA